MIRAGEVEYERVKIDVIHSGPLSRTVRAGRMVHRMVPQGGCGRPCLEIAGLGNSLSRIRDAGVKTAQGCRTCRYGPTSAEAVAHFPGMAPYQRDSVGVGLRLSFGNRQGES